MEARDGTTQSSALADRAARERDDRAYKYDHAGRLVEAFTSQQADDYRQAGAVGAGGGQYVPYRQTYSYDAWGNRTYRDNWYWERQDIHNASFSDNRRTETGWQYDGAGNPTQTPDVGMSYDAAGRNRVTASLISGAKVITQWQDGDGRVVKRVEEGGGTAAETVFYLRSGALGGVVVAELNAQGVKTKGNIYLGGALIAEHGEHQPSGARWVEWKHHNPLTGSRGVSDSGAYFRADEAGERDPMGIAFGPPTLAFPAEGLPDEGGPSARYGAGVPNGQCTLDGMTVDCADANQLMRHGLVAHAPDTMVRFNNELGRLESFQAYADGFSGFMARNERYLGGGFVMDMEENITRLDRDPRSSLPQSAGLQWLPNSTDISEKKRKEIEKYINEIAVSQKCLDAFKSAGILSPADVVSGGLTLGTRRSLFSLNESNPGFGITAYGRSATLKKFDSGREAPFAIALMNWIGIPPERDQVTDGRAKIIFNPSHVDQGLFGNLVDSLTGSTLKRRVIHEMIHASGAGPVGDDGWNDLKWLGEKGGTTEADIVKACQ